MKDEDLSPKMDRRPLLLISKAVMRVSIVLSRQLSLCLKRHQHQLLRPIQAFWNHPSEKPDASCISSMPEPVFT
jgi:hypothetical protein